MRTAHKAAVSAQLHAQRRKVRLFLPIVVGLGWKGNILIGPHQGMRDVSTAGNGLAWLGRSRLGDRRCGFMLPEGPTVIRCWDTIDRKRKAPLDVEEWLLRA